MAVQAIIGSQKFDLIHSVVISEFDIFEGMIVAHVFPDNKLDEFKKDQIAALCLPDGGHKVKEDYTYLLLQDENGQPLYGVSFFRNKKDPTVQRGAVMKSLLLVLRKPYFVAFQAIAKATLMRFMEEGDPDVLKTVYDSIRAGFGKSVEVALWNRQFILNYPVIDSVCDFGVPLTFLVTIFKNETMLIWHALISGKRLLFIGEDGNTVGKCTLAAPLVVAPLKGYEDVTTPYVCLSDLSPLDKQFYICGCNNPVMQNDESLYDIIANTSDGVVQSNSRDIRKVKPSEKKFINKVLSEGSTKGDRWVRKQFLEYTTEFLENVQQNNLRGVFEKYSEFKQSKQFQRYLHEKRQRANTTDLSVVSQSLEQLKDLQKDDSADLNAVQITKLYYDLDHNISSSMGLIEHVCQMGGVQLVTKSLNSPSSQIRKYSINILNQLASSNRGHSQIIRMSVMKSIANLLNDIRPNIVLSACICLEKISSRPRGEKAIVDLKIHDVLLQLLTSDSSDMRMKYCVVVLLHRVYLNNPSLYPDAAKHPAVLRELISSDRHYVSVLLQLCDTWEMEIKEATAPSDVLAKALEYSVSKSSREEGFKMMFELAQNNRAHRISMVINGAMENIIRNIDSKSAESFICWRLLPLLGKCNIGLRRITRLRIVGRATEMLNQDIDLMPLWDLECLNCVCYCLESLANLEGFPNEMVKTSVIHVSVNVIHRHYDSHGCSRIVLTLARLLGSLWEYLQDDHTQSRYLNEAKTNITTLQEIQFDISDQEDELIQFQIALASLLSNVGVDDSSTLMGSLEFLSASVSYQERRDTERRKSRMKQKTPFRDGVKQRKVQQRRSPPKQDFSNPWSSMTTTTDPREFALDDSLMFKPPPPRTPHPSGTRRSKSMKRRSNSESQSKSKKGEEKPGHRRTATTPNLRFSFLSKLTRH